MLLSLSAAWAESRAWAKAETILISREGQPPGTTGRGYAPAISADGRFVAFSDGSDVLVRDLQAGTTVLASPASGPDGVEGSSGLYPDSPAISADGRFVAFAWNHANLNPENSNEFSRDIFVSDLLSGTTTLASRASGASGATGNSYSAGPSISADGRYVAFTSGASNLDSDDTEQPGGFEALDVFVRDRLTGTTTLVSRASGSTGADGNGASLSPSISADGRFVAFQSLATNLHPDDADRRSDIYVRDLQTTTTIFVGRGPARSRRTGVPEDAGGPSISSDGQFVAFSTSVHFDVEPVEYWQDVVFVRNLQHRTTTLVSVTTTGATADGTSPSLSANGRYVAFSSHSSNLQPFHNSRFPDIFVRDLVRRRTILVSRAAGRVGTPGNGGSHGPSISADGRLVVFESRAANLHLEDRDRSGDVFMRNLGSAPFEAQASHTCGGRTATLIVLPGSWFARTRKPWPFGGSDEPDVVVGSPAGDHVAGGSGRDRICGRGGPDGLDGGAGRDRIAGGTGADMIRSADRSPDSVDCGPGRDLAIIDQLDRVRRCERVRERSGRA